MDSLIVDVKLWGNSVGSLVWDSNLQCASFEYEPTFKKLGLEIAPLTMKVPARQGQVFQFLGNRGNSFSGLPGLIADSLPDSFGNQIITEWFAAQNTPLDTVTPLDRLCYIGTRAMGALEFEPSKKLGAVEESTQVHVDELSRLAEDIFRKRIDFKASLEKQEKPLMDILHIGTSAGGAKPKAIIAYNEKTQEVRSGQVTAPDGFGYWLLKFDGVSYSEHDSITEIPRGIGNVEYAYYKMALAAGLQMSECRLLNEGDYNHFMTRRFDRGMHGEKIHMQTLSAMAHMDRDTRHSYEELIGIIRKLGMDEQTIRQMFRRAAFNVLAYNNDDHTKNTSFLMDQNGKWSLAPAYDICFACNAQSQWINKHQMSINGKQENISKTDLLEFASRMDVRGAKEDLQQVSDAVESWSQFATECGVRKNHMEEIQKILAGKAL